MAAGSFENRSEQDPKPLIVRQKFESRSNLPFRLR
jgi:hypothetical protein